MASASAVTLADAKADLGGRTFQPSTLRERNMKHIPKYQRTHQHPSTAEEHSFVTTRKLM